MTEETTGKLIASIRNLISLRRNQLSLLHVMYYSAECQLNRLVTQHGMYLPTKDGKVRDKLMAISAALNVGMDDQKLAETQKLLNAEHKKDREEDGK
jgi:hypothetical protein